MHLSNRFQYARRSTCTAGPAGERNRTRFMCRSQSLYLRSSSTRTYVRTSSQSVSSLCLLRWFSLSSSSRTDPLREAGTCEWHTSRRRSDASKRDMAAALHGIWSLFSFSLTCLDQNVADKQDGCCLKRVGWLFFKIGWKKPTPQPG